MIAEEMNSSDSDATVSYDADNSTPPSGDIENTPPENAPPSNAMQVEERGTGPPEPADQVVEIPLQAVTEQVVLGSQNSISTISTEDEIIKPRNTKKRKR